MTFLQAIFFAIVQGVSELFPVSSLGHAVILPAALGWHVDQDSPQFLPFLVVLHLGTATALLIYFWRVWWSLFLALIGQTDRAAENRHLIKLLIIGTLPAVVLGFVFEHKLRHLFGSPVAAAVFLILNGFILFAGERLRRRALRAADRRELGDANWRDAVVVGFCQTLAFFPGISRSGTTIVGGLLVGLRHEDAARLFVFAGHSGHRGCGGSRNSETAAFAARRRRRGNERERVVDRGVGCRRHGLCQHRVSDALLPQPRRERRPRSIRLLLLGGGFIGIGLA